MANGCEREAVDTVTMLFNETDDGDAVTGSAVTLHFCDTHVREWNDSQS